MNCYAIVNNGKQSLKRLGDKIIISLSKQKIFSKYRVFGRIIALESEQKLSDLILNNKHLYPCIFTGSKEKDIYESIKRLIQHAIPTKNFAIRVDRKGEHNYTSTELARNVAGAVFDKWTNITVDLDSPELEICVQIINNKCIIYLKYS
jgi:adenylyl- and sulfurtransferase ThiI